MKKFICGLLTGVLICGTAAFAANYEAVTAGFKVLVNGEEFHSDPPALVVEGRTYLPLRAIGDALGVPVNWNDELGQAEVGTVTSGGGEEYSRNNPAPIGTSQFVKVDNYSEKYMAGIRVVEVERGDSAWEKIKATNMFNKEPDAGYEYALIKVAISISDVEGDKAINVSSYNFKSFTGTGEEVPFASVVVPEPQLTGSMYSGGDKTGYIVLQVKQGDQMAKMVYGAKYDGTGGIWFALQ